MSNYYQKYIKYKKKYLVAKNAYLNQLGSSASSPPGSPKSSISRISSRPPQIKKKRKIVEEVDWTDLYDVGEEVMWNKGIYSRVVGKTKEPSSLIIEKVSLSIDSDTVLPGPFPVKNSKLIKPIPGNLRRIYLYGGCLCPPHKGHLDLIAEKTLELTGPNDKMIIGLEGDDIRHNFKTEKSIKIINRFLELKEDIGANRVIIKNVGSNRYKFPQLEVIRSIATTMNLSYRDKITVIVGEDYIREGKLKRFIDNIGVVEDDFNIDIEYIIRTRPECSILSSTNLEELIKSYKSSENKEDFDIKLKQFLPDEFADNELEYAKIKEELLN